MKAMVSTICKSSIIFVCGLLIASCASVPNVLERPDAGSAATEESAESASEARDKATPVGKTPAHAPVIAREIERQEPELEAVKYLLNQAEDALENSETGRAGALLNRVLQIDRKSPRAYLVLAKVFYLEENPGQAKVTAQQGLLYTSRYTPVGRQLTKLAQADSLQ